MRRLTLVIVCLSVSVFSLALDPHKKITQYVHEVWGIEQGLPQNSVVAVIQTRDGYLWLGTAEGLVRFDGVRFEVFDKRRVEQLSSNHIRAFYEDREGNLWIGTRGGGLTCLNTKKGKFTTYTKKQGLSSDRIRAITGDREGGLWIGTVGGGLNRLKGGKFTIFTSEQGLSHDIVRSICEDREGSLWIGTDQGLTRLKDGKFKVFTSKQGLSHDLVWSVYEDSEGSLWIGTDQGLTRLKDGKFTRYTTKEGLSNDRIISICEDSDGSLWIGTYGGGLNRLKDGKFTAFTSKQGLSNDIVRCICEDREGSLWIGTWSGGLNCLKDGKFTVFTSKQGLSHDLVWSVYEDSEGSMWFGTDQGLNRLKDGEFTIYTTKDGLSHNMVMSIYEDREGSLWIGTNGGGLNRLNRYKKDGKFTTYTTKHGLSHDDVWCIYEDLEGSLWIGTWGGGLNRLKDGKFTSYTTKEGLSSDFLYSIYEDRKGSLWIGTERGLNRLDLHKKDGTLTAYTIKEGLSNDIIRGLYEDREGSLWIGTMGGGLNRLKDGKFSSITTKDGLFNDTVHQILEDDRGNFWMSCNKGIFMVDKKELDDFCQEKRNKVHCVSYDEKDGMKTRECNGISQPSGWKSHDGALWFPTMKGAVMIDPNNIKINRLPPPVVIESLTLDSKEILPPFTGDEDKLVISPGYERFEIKYTGLSFLVANRVRFKYKLEGFNKDWIDVGTRRIAYFNKIPPGNYRFQVLACNNDGKWNETGASIPFYIKPYYYQTCWFYLVCGLAVIFLVYGGYRWRVRQLKKREVELETLVAQRTAQLQKANEVAREEREIADAANRSKSLFLARMSHEIRTPMNSVIGFAEMLMDSGLNEEQLDYAATINRSGEALLSIIDDILDFSKIEAGKLAFEPIDFSPEETAFDVCELILPRIGSRPIEVFCRVSDQVPAYVKQDPGRFRQVLINLMGNAVKFTREGEIDLSIDVEEEGQNRLMLHSKVRDTGIGISADRLNTIFEVFQQEDGSTTRKFGGTGLGLTICKQIARHMGGDIQVESTPGKGSTFHFYAWVEKSGKKPEPKPVMVNLAGKRVLIVDDNRNNLDILEHILKKHSMSVVKQLGGEGVISIIQENVEKGTPIDLGILDLIMPGLNGYELAAQIRKLDPPISNLPLLALSSSVIRQSKKYREAGFDGFLTKPVQSQRLIQVIEGLLVSRVSQVPEVPQEPQAQHLQEEIAVQQQLAFDDVKQDVHILLVEDNPINRKLVSSMLTKAGYRLDTVENGKEAVEKYLSTPGKYNLIFMDVQMPEMDGREATRMIREKEEQMKSEIQNSKFKIQNYPHIPIIAMTAQSMKGDYEKCLEAGMNDYISKPIRKKVVLEMVEKWVGSKR